MNNNCLTFVVLLNAACLPSSWCEIIRNAVTPLNEIRWFSMLWNCGDNRKESTSNCIAYDKSGSWDFTEVGFDLKEQRHKYLCIGIVIIFLSIPLSVIGLMKDFYFVYRLDIDGRLNVFRLYRCLDNFRLHHSLDTLGLIIDIWVVNHAVHLL